MMEQNFWIFCHYAQQPPFNTMLRYHNWGKYLKGKGYKVTIVAASTVHNTDIDVIEECEGNKEQYVDDVRYLYVSTPRYTGNGIGRMKNMLSFCMGLRKYRKLPAQPDCIAICEAYLLPFVKSVYRKTPIICDIVDLWPLSIVEYTSFSDHNLLIKFLYRIEQVAYIRSAAIIFSMEGGIDYLKERKYASRINYNKVFHINIGCDLSTFDKNAVDLVDKSKSNKTSFVVTYCGSIRKANHIIQLCEAARILKESGYSMIEMRLYGNGLHEEEAKSFCKRNELENVAFYGRVDRNKLPFIFSDSDINIMTYMQTRVMKYGGSQSKLFDYLASGKPIISCGSWGYNLVSRYDCGVVVKEQTGKNIAEAICTLYELPRFELRQMGERARKAAENYNQPEIIDKLLQVLSYVKK